MSLSLNPIRFILVCIFLTPIVNNINGFMMFKFGVSALGPAFYSLFLLVTCLSLLSFRFEGKVLLNNYLMIAGIIAWYGAHTLMYGGVLLWFRYFIKFFLPFVLYRFLRLYYSEGRDLVLRYLGGTLYVWGGMAVITAALHIKPSAGEGYYGFIDGNNDYVVMLFALFPVLRVWRSGLQKTMYYLAVLLTRSKGLMALGVMLFLRQKSKWVKVFALAALAVTVSYYVAYFRGVYSVTGLPSFAMVARFLSFGRFHFFGILWDHFGEKPWLDYLIGSGFGGAEIYTEGKMGIEMDLVDTLNIFGALGLAIVAWFYFGKVASLKTLSRGEKTDFLPLFLYSILGGHLLFNPVSNVVFVLILFLLEDEDAMARLRHGERPG